MSTHAAALGITALAYFLARHYMSDYRFAFGTWKIEILGGFVSGILLGLVAAYMIFESLRRFFKPIPIQYNQAIIVAVIGLIVNVVSALILKDHKEEGHSPAESGTHNHKDLNVHAAYLHVLADAMTSVLALIALGGGKYMNWNWLDPTMGIVGAVLIARWTYSLLRDTGNILLDREMDAEMLRAIRQTVESDGDARVSDLHVWRVGRDRYACILALVACHPHSPEHYKNLLKEHEELAHITIEISPCPDELIH